MPDLATQEERWLALYRDLRHETVNHCQVVSGWLQMNRTDRAHQYVHEVAQSLGAASVLVRQPSALALCLLETHTLAARLGVSVAWDVEDDAVAAALAALEPLGELLHAALDDCRGAVRLHVRLARGPDQLEVRLTRTGGHWRNAPVTAPGVTALWVQQ